MQFNIMEMGKITPLFTFTHSYVGFSNYARASFGLIAVAVVTWEQSKGDWIDAVLLGGRGALGVRDVYLELNRLLEDGGARCRFVLGPKTRLRDDAVTEAGNLRKEKCKARHTLSYLEAPTRNLNGNYLQKCGFCVADGEENITNPEVLLF